MDNAPRNTLPGPEQIRIAIRHWFQGGGTANLITNVCRREMATLEEAAALAKRLAERAAKGNGFISDEVVVQNLELIRAIGAAVSDAETAQAKSPNPPIGSDEWLRRAAERAERNRWAENAYKGWTWEKPKAQARSW